MDAVSTDSRATTTPAGPGARRHLICTAVTDVRAHPEAERAELADDVRRIEELFVGELGYRKATEPGLNPTKEQLTTALRAFATAPDRGAEDHVVLYVAAHGVTADSSGRHYLLLHDSDAHDLRGTALPTEDLVAELWEDTAIERLLVLIDACYAEEGTDKALRGALEARRFREPVTEHGNTGLALVASSRRKEETYTGALSAAFDRAVRRQATAGHAPAHISLEHIMAAIRSDPEVPPAQRPVWSLTHATGDIPAFLPNPRHIPDSAGLKLEEIDRFVALGARERDARDQDMRGFFLPRARGTDVPAEEVWDFTGRHAALADITSWLAPQRVGERLCVVTGDPGSGKSSLLGMVAVLTDPQRGTSVPRAGLPALLPEQRAVDVAVNASHLSTRQLLEALSAAAGCAAESLGALAAQLQTRTGPLVVLIDSLDEALAPHETVDELLTPLIDPERRLPLRLLVGARPHIATRLPTAAQVIDLDSERYGDPAAVRAYARKLLCPPGSALITADPHRVDAIAEAVAEAAGRSFLVARITARTIAREPRPPDPYDQRWREELPRLPGEAMERDLVQRLGPDAGRARDLLLPLAYAQGAGLPWAGVWPRLASALTGHDYGDEHIVWLRQAAGSYVVESLESGGSVYRVYHRALIEYLREGRDTERIQRSVTEVLRDLDHPYVRRYLALHAGEGGVLDPLVQDARFVLDSHPGQLLSALPRLRTADGQRAGQAVRDLEELLRDLDGSGYGPDARARLRLAAVCRRAQALADSCDEGEEELPWRARWAVWNPNDGARRYEGTTLGIDGGVVVPDEGGVDYLNVSPRDGVTWWDLDPGTWRRVEDRTGDPQSWTLTAPPQLPGHAAALAYGERLGFERDRLTMARHARLLYVWSGIRRTWLLPSGPAAFDVEPDRRALRTAAQVVVLADDYAPTAAALRFDDGHLFVYRLSDSHVLSPTTRRQRRSLSGYDLRNWEAQAQWLDAEFMLALEPEGARKHITACAAPLGLPPMTILLGYSDGGVVEFSAEDAASGAEVRTGHDGPVTCVDLVTGHALGRLLVTAGEDRTVRVSSLAGGEPVRTLLTSAFDVASFAVRRVGRQWIVAVATSDGQLHRIDLDSGRPIGLPLRVDRGTSVRVAAFELGATACVSVQGDRRGLQLYDLITGDRMGGQVQDHSVTAVCEVGETVLLGGSDGIVRFWPTPHAADSTQITAHEGPVLALGEIRGPSGAIALVGVGGDYEIRCWDLYRHRELWRRRILDPGRWQVPLVGCATTGRTADGHDLVVTGEYGGRVGVLVLSEGLPTAEQEFTVPDIVTALATGRVRGRDVVVVGTGSGRLFCWDVGAGRMYAHGPLPDEPVWTTALALAPDGSGRLGVGGFDGSVRQWSMPTCRPLEPARPAHRGRVCALAYVGGHLVGSGSDHRLVSYSDGWERRMPHPLCSFRPTADGLLCGDESGLVWRLSASADGWQVAEALDAVRPVWAVAPVSVEGRFVVVEGSLGGSLQLRDGADGTLTDRLRPVCRSGSSELATVSWRSPGRAPQPLLFSRSLNGLLEYWDPGSADGFRPEGSPLATPVPHSAESSRLTTVPDGQGAQALLSLATWDADPAPTHWFDRDRQEDMRLAVYDIAGGPLVDHPCHPMGKDGIKALHAVRCDGRLLVFVSGGGPSVCVLDTKTLRWAHLPVDLVDVFTLAAPQGDELLVVCGGFTAVLDWEIFRTSFESREGPRAHRVPLLRRAPILNRLPRRGRARPPAVTHQHSAPFSPVLHTDLLPGGDTYVVAGHRAVAVLGTRDGTVRRLVPLPSRSTALATGPDGELIVGTRNGPILFDRL